MHDYSYIASIHIHTTVQFLIATDVITMLVWPAGYIFLAFCLHGNNPIQILDCCVPVCKFYGCIPGRHIALNLQCVLITRKELRKASTKLIDVLGKMII